MIPFVRFPHVLLFVHTVLALAVPAFAARASEELLIDADHSLAWAPAADFSHELDRLAPPGTATFHAVLPEPGTSKEEQSARVERMELEHALSDSEAADPAHGGPGRPGQPATDRAAVLFAYAQARKAVGALESANPDHLQGTLAPTDPAAPRSPSGMWDALLGSGNLPGPGAPAVLEMNLPVPPGLSDEFAEHLRALGDYYAGHTTAARDRWQRLLERPEDRRRRRTVWATFMIGKTWLNEEQRVDKDDPNPNAVEWFRRTRQRAAEGRPDPLGLAAASLGWEAYAELRDGHFRRAVELYLQAHATGDPSADESLALMCKDWFSRRGSVREWADLAGDPVIADVVTAYAMAEGTRYIPRPKAPAVLAWLSAVESAKAEKAIGPARLALVALQNDDPGAAGRLLAAAPADDPLALWLRGKLAATAGDLDGSAGLLARAAAGFRPDEVWLDVSGGGYVEMHSALVVADRVRAELGVVELARGNYAGSLGLFLRAGWLSDAAYVAECVLTPEELIAFAGRDEWGATGNATRDQLARRLTRLGRWKQARPYFTAPKQALLDAYITAIRQGHDADRSEDDRADSLWRAALLAREHGVELFGHDTVPGLGSDRGRGAAWLAYTIVGARQHPPARTFLGATPDELRRVSAGAPPHYSRTDARLVASEHAWSAAALMPDESDETARRLCVAGTWLKSESPDAARRFYRALIDRCGTTRLGKEAVRVNWFPALN